MDPRWGTWRLFSMEKIPWATSDVDLSLEGRKSYMNNQSSRVIWKAKETEVSSDGGRCPSAEVKPAAAAKSLPSCPTLCDPIDGSPPGSPVPGILQSTVVGCHFLLQCMEVKSESEVAQSWTLRDLMDCSPPGSSVHGIFQARVLEWGAFAFSESEAVDGGTPEHTGYTKIASGRWGMDLGRMGLEGGQEVEEIRSKKPNKRQ